MISRDDLPYWALIGLVIVALFMVAMAKAARADDYPISVPSECTELAQREGVPLVIENKRQGAIARVKLAALSRRDPMVRECRAAVERLKAARKAVQ